jgi:hypothetical protein
MSLKKGVTLTAIIVVILIALASGVLYRYIVSGGLIARQKPVAAETNVTRWMLNVSVPDSAKAMKNPLRTDAGGEDYLRGGKYTSRNAMSVITTTEVARPRRAAVYTRLRSIFAGLRSTRPRMENCFTSSGTASETQLCRAGKYRTRIFGD